VSRRIMNEIEGIARVVCDISGKRPGSIDQEQGSSIFAPIWLNKSRQAL
jgi:hypothetical protein